MGYIHPSQKTLGIAKPTKRKGENIGLVGFEDQSLLIDAPGNQGAGSDSG